MAFGGYQPGDTCVHRLDPRLKLLACGGLVAATFAARGWLPLAVCLLALALLLLLGRFGWRRAGRLLWAFRWLFLSSLLLHACLSPGHTLFGLDWLSRDGLLRGQQVCVQIAVAMLGAALLAASTPPELLARACGWFLRPLERLGCPVPEWEGLMLLALRFIPVLQQRVAASAAADEGGNASRRRRFAAWQRRLVGLLDEIVVEADGIAQRIVAGEERLAPVTTLPPLRSLTALDLTAVAAAVALSLGYLLLGG